MSRERKAVNPYEVLGVSLAASDDEIKAAYKAKILANHPDKGGDTEEFRKVQDAYDMLTKQQQNQNQRQRQMRERCDIEYPLPLSQFMKGTTVSLPLQTRERCKCLSDPNKTIRCYQCNGRLTLPPCSKCGGRGVISTCRECKGQGVIDTVVTVSLEIKPGHGDVYTITDDKLPRPLTVKVRPEPENNFSYQDGKLITKCDIDINLALNSGMYELTLPDDHHVKVFIPSVTNLYQSLLVCGSGIVVSKEHGSKRGELIIEPNWITSKKYDYELPTDPQIIIAEEVRVNHNHDEMHDNDQDQNHYQQQQFVPGCTQQ
jgi:DnaJ-class molecular chaperone